MSMIMKGVSVSPDNWEEISLPFGKYGCNAVVKVDHCRLNIHNTPKSESLHP